MPRSCCRVLLVACCLTGDAWGAEPAAAGGAVPPAMLKRVRDAWQSASRRMPRASVSWSERYDAPLIPTEEDRPLAGDDDSPPRQHAWCDDLRLRVRLELPGNSESPFNILKRKPPLGDFTSVHKSGFSIGAVPILSPVRADCWMDDESRTDAVVPGDGQRLFARVSGRQSAVNAHFGVREHATVRALLMAFRPEWLVPDFVFERNDALRTADARLGGDGLVRLSWIDLESQIDREIWVDPAREFSVRRSVARQGSQCLEQIDVEFEQPAEGLWAPLQWTVVFTRVPDKFTRAFPGQRELFGSLRATEVRCDFDAPVPAKLLTADFPPLAVVHDERDRTWFTVSPSGVRESLPTATAMRLVLSEEEPAGGPVDRVALAGIVAIAGVALFAGRRYLRKKSRSSAAVNGALLNSRGLGT